MREYRLVVRTPNDTAMVGANKDQVLAPPTQYCRRPDMLEGQAKRLFEFYGQASHIEVYRRGEDMDSYIYRTDDPDKGIGAVRALVQNGVFQLGDFELHSGSRAKFKIDCDMLQDTDMVCLAALLALKLKPFGSVKGIPEGGLRLAKRMEQFKTVGPLLIVDDVCTTGKSLETARASVPGVIGGVLFARGPVPEWVTPLFTMSA